MALYSFVTFMHSLMQQGQSTSRHPHMPKGILPCFEADFSFDFNLKNFFYIKRNDDNPSLPLMNCFWAF